LKKCEKEIKSLEIIIFNVCLLVYVWVQQFEKIANDKKIVKRTVVLEKLKSIFILKIYKKCFQGFSKNAYEGNELYIKKIIDILYIFPIYTFILWIFLITNGLKVLYCLLNFVN
jgi:hypothetical protein